MRTVITTFQFVCVHVYCENVMANISDEKTKIKKSKKLVQWTADMDNTLCIQILAEQPYQYKKYLKELTRTWDLIQKALSVVEGFELIDTDQIRDHYSYIIKKRKVACNKELKLTFVDIQRTPLEITLDECIEDMEGYEKQHDQQTAADEAKDENEKKAAIDVQNASMKTFSRKLGSPDSSGKSDDENTPPRKRQRRSSTKTVQFLRDNQEFKKELHEDEMKLRH